MAGQRDPLIEFRGGAYRIQTICLGPVPEWHVVAARLNEPVGRLDYVAHK